MLFMNSSTPWIDTSSTSERIMFNRFLTSSDKLSMSTYVGLLVTPKNSPNPVRMNRMRFGDYIN